MSQYPTTWALAFIRISARTSAEEELEPVMLFQAEVFSEHPW